MGFLILKALISGAIIAAVADVSKRFPGLGGLIASLPLISVLGMIWIWSETREPERLAAHAQATFWFVLPSLPMFLLIPFMLRRGWEFWPALIAGCVLTMALYAAMLWVGPRFGLKL